MFETQHYFSLRKNRQEFHLCCTYGVICDMNVFALAHVLTFNPKIFNVFRKYILKLEEHTGPYITREGGGQFDLYSGQQSGFLLSNIMLFHFSFMFIE